MKYLKTIRMAVVSVAVLFAFAGQAFAASVMLPVSVVENMGTSATLHAYVQNPYELSVVWFEWSEGSSVSAPSIIAMKDFFGDGAFTARLSGLTPGNTYSFRAAIKSNGVTVYSPVSSFVATTPKATTPTTVTIENPTILLQAVAPKVTQSAAQSGSTKQTPAPASTQFSSNNGNDSSVNKNNTVSGSSEPRTDGFGNGGASPVTATNGFSNGNGAAVIGAGDGIFPTTLIGWILLLIAILTAVLVSHMIYESSMKRNKKKDEENHGLEAAHA